MARDDSPRLGLFCAIIIYEMPLFGFQMRLFSPEYSPVKGKNRNFSPAVSEALLESIRDGQGFFSLILFFLVKSRSTLFLIPSVAH